MDKIKGTAAGMAAALAAVLLWVLIGFIGFIAGIAGALIGILFTIVYKKVNPQDKSKYAVVAACIVIVLYIVLAELIVIAILASAADVPFSFALQIEEIKNAIFIDIGVGLLLSFVSFGGYLYSSSRKSSLDKRRIYTGTGNPENTQTQFPPQASADPFEVDSFESAQSQSFDTNTTGQ